jgi:hypothetical protein
VNETVGTSIDTQIAELVRLVPQPREPLGYGSDLSCVSDLTVDLDEVDPFSMQAIGEAAIRRLTTARAALLDDRDYGIDVRAYCNRGTTLAELAELGGRCALELAKDDRIESARVTVTRDANGSALSISVVITAADPTLAPFTLTFAVTSGAAVLEAIG